MGVAIYHNHTLHSVGEGGVYFVRGDEGEGGIESEEPVFIVCKVSEPEDLSTITAYIYIHVQVMLQLCPP